MEDQEVKQAVLASTEVLRAAGIRTVSISYSGMGDEGKTEEPQLEGTAGEPVALNGSEDFDLVTIGGLLELFVPESYADNDGGWGTVTFDVESGKIRVEHNWYETVSHAAEPREI
jgi:hypothetical protein